MNHLSRSTYSSRSRIALALLALIPIGFLCIAQFAQSQDFKDPELEMRDYMVEISRHLGVTCTHCHNLKDFKSQKKKPWKMAKNHIELVNTLNQNHLDKLGIDKADCFMCHRGKLKPEYQEKLSVTD